MRPGDAAESCPVDKAAAWHQDAGMNTFSAFTGCRLNAAASQIFQLLEQSAATSNCRVRETGGARLIDAGVSALGGLQAGIGLARLCLGDHASVSLQPGADPELAGVDVWVHTDQPVAACLGGQYAGWPVSHDSYFAMASGPMRMFRGREELLNSLELVCRPEESSAAVGVLESDSMPDESVVELVASECGVSPTQLRLAVAPSTSVAGSIQVVSRSVETALHKLHALEFDVTKIVTATGVSPLPPPAKPGDTIGGIGRTNDAMLYGARVTLWSDAEDDAIEAVAAAVPSENSPDHGRPFCEIFRDYDHDFYKVDPMLFSPAVVTIHSLRSGRTWRSGRTQPQILQKSFGV